jgi:HAD superfamily hydrolase (TIGR01509 family)
MLESVSSEYPELRAFAVSRVAAIIFDFDGLVIDSETPLFDIWASIYAEHGQTLTMDEWQHTLGTDAGFDPYAALASRAALALDRGDLAERVRREHWRLCGEQPLLPGVRDRLLEARQLGFKTAVASSSPSAWVEPWLAVHHLRPLFDAVCTRDDVRKVKPEPELFLLAATRLDIAPKACLVFEDSPNGIRAAQAAGMRVVAVPSGLTAGLPLPAPDLVVPSLADVSLHQLLAKIERASQKR